MPNDDDDDDDTHVRTLSGKTESMLRSHHYVAIRVNVVFSSKQRDKQHGLLISNSSKNHKQ